MDPLQSSALDALAPFLALASSATSPRAAADLISQAVAAPQTYVFAELLQTPNIQALHEAEEQWSRWLRVLEIFCWGTFAEYQGKKSARGEAHTFCLATLFLSLSSACIPITLLTDS